MIMIYNHDKIGMIMIIQVDFIKMNTNQRRNIYITNSTLLFKIVHLRINRNN